ncbi:ADP-ribosyltransferase, partial [Actinomadura sp. HBU206391]|uniref:ADP-ribosyltransferase n=1 Tax=Actinomadura sp. HBU206391 TaxID=2731692 RepID=UPI001C9D1EE2
VCRVAGGPCEAGRPAGSTAAPRPALNPPSHGREGANGADGGGDDDDGTHLCKNPLWGRDDDGCLRHPMVKFVRGAALGGWDAVKGAWEGAGSLGCLLHACSHQGFKDDWSGLKDSFSLDGLRSMWEGMTEHCRKATVEQGTRCAVNWASAIFGAGGAVRKLTGHPGGDLLGRLEKSFGPVARRLEALGLSGVVIERLLEQARRNGVQKQLESIADHAVSGTIPKDLAQKALYDLDDASRRGRLDADTYRRLLRELADAGDEATFRVAHARLQSVFAQRALVHGDAAGARQAADAAEAALAEARGRYRADDPSLARIEAETVQAQRVADLAEQLRALGRLDAGTLELLKRHGVNLEIVRTGDPGSRSLTVTRTHYNSDDNTLVIRSDRAGRPVTDEFLRFTDEELPDLAAERRLAGQPITDWDGLDTWWQGARHHPTDRAYREWVDSTLRPVSTGLPNRSRQAIARYRLDDSYQRINGALRGGRMSPATERDIAEMDEAMLLSRVPEDLIVTRRAGADGFDRPIDQLEGTVQAERGFLSTSTQKTPLLMTHMKNNSAELATMYLRVPKGTPGVHMSGIPYAGRGNTELLLARGSRYRIDKVVHEDGRWKVFGTVVRDTDAAAPS